MPDSGWEYDKQNTREAFGDALLRYARTDDRVFAVSADTEKSMGFAKLAEEKPERVINVGIAEQNMILVAAGIAACGGKAFAATYAPFASMRILEQVRTFCAYPNLDVKVVSGLGGFAGAVEGVTHQGLEDVSVMRAIPNLVVVVAADAASTAAITRKICEHEGPAYLRVGRTPVPKVFGDDYRFSIGEANVVKAEGEDAAVLFNGAVASRVLEAERRLREKGYGVRLVEMPCVKPLDSAAVLAAGQTGAVVTVEENSILGGLGGAVAEVLGENCPTWLRRVGIEDVFAESGTQQQLMDKYGLGVAHIEKAVEETVARKKRG